MDPGYKFLRKKRRIRQRTSTRTERSNRGGKLPGVINRKTELKETRAKLELLGTGAPFATDLMDKEIARLGELMELLYPWNDKGKQLQGKSVQAYYWASEMRRDYLALRAPYQSPRLSAMAVVTPPSAQRTDVNVTILDERGNKVFSDIPADAPAVEDMREIAATEDEEAA